MLIAGGVILLVCVWLFGFVCGAAGMKGYIKGLLVKALLDEERLAKLSALDGRANFDGVTGKRLVNKHGACVDPRCMMCHPEGPAVPPTVTK